MIRHTLSKLNCWEFWDVTLCHPKDGFRLTIVQNKRIFFQKKRSVLCFPSLPEVFFFFFFNLIKFYRREVAIQKNPCLVYFVLYTILMYFYNKRLVNF